MICINPLDHLELYLNLLTSLSYKENRPLLHREGLVEADIDVSRVKSDHVKSAVSLNNLLVAALIAFFYKASLALLSSVGKGADL